MQHPPNCLDYHLWDHIDKMAQQNEINTSLDQKREVVRAFQNVNMEEVKKAIMSWQKRAEACVAAEGDRFEYAL